MNLTKTWSHVKGYINVYIGIKFESSSMKNSLRNVKKAQITNEAIMYIFNRYSKLCYKQHTLSLGAIFRPEMEWDRKHYHTSHTQRGTKYDVLSWIQKITKY